MNLLNLFLEKQNTIFDFAKSIVTMELFFIQLQLQNRSS